LFLARQASTGVLIDQEISNQNKQLAHSEIGRDYEDVIQTWNGAIKN
tara:strand:- start:43 stop:183 length:141 start_codon:yes stop_codon:yes gene_type:complete